MRAAATPRPRVSAACGSNGVRVATFALSGMAAGLAGTIDASRVLSAQATSGQFLTFTVLTGIIVGGTSILGGEGSMQRTVLGCLFVALIANGFNLLGLDPFYQQITLGVILLVAVGLDAWSRRPSDGTSGIRRRGARAHAPRRPRRLVVRRHADARRARPRTGCRGRSSSGRRRAPCTPSSRSGHSRPAAGSAATCTRSRRRCTSSRASSRSRSAAGSTTSSRATTRS